MACETLYVCKHVQGIGLGESEPDARGIEIHEVLASYIDHLVRARRATDLEVFDALVRGAGAEAREVLETFRNNHAFDPEKILATELHIALDENFRPIEHPGQGSPRIRRFSRYRLDARLDGSFHQARCGVPWRGSSPGQTRGCSEMSPGLRVLRRQHL